MNPKKMIPILTVLLLFVLLGGPQIIQAQATPQQTSPNAGTTEPPAALPNAPSASAQQQPASDSQPAQQQKNAQAPLGAAAAPAGRTAGGAASKPAGTAIAPAKQRQVRSFLIKLGLIAAGGAAIGTVVALTRGTGSLPPGAK